MPYRRLPNTDAARIRAMEIIAKKEVFPDDKSLPYSLSIKQRVDFFLPKFKMVILTTQESRKKQLMHIRKHNECARKARLYISHFIQVLNFTIIRGELKKSIRNHYGFSENSSKLPSLISEQELLKWGERVINGEQERVRSGGTPIYSPSIALVKVNYENFKQSYFLHHQSQLNTSRLNSDIVQCRRDADALILSLWNEIEAAYASLEDDEYRRKQCEEYGVVYVFRK